MYTAGDRVQVVNYDSDYYARRGEVTRITADGVVMVRMDFLGCVLGFHVDSLGNAPDADRPVNRDATL